MQWMKKKFHKKCKLNPELSVHELEHRIYMRRRASLLLYRSMGVHESALGCMRVNLDHRSALRSQQCTRMHESALRSLECTGIQESAFWSSECTLWFEPGNSLFWMYYTYIALMTLNSTAVSHLGAPSWYSYPMTCHSLILGVQPGDQMLCTGALHVCIFMRAIA